MATAAALFPNMQQSQEQQQQATDAEYLLAQQAAAETVHIGRATLEQASQQAEQLENATEMANETQYKLDKAGRLLRGMTWSGWVANAFTKRPVAGSTTSTSPQRRIPDTYESVPPQFQNVAQAVQNYHANLKVFQECTSTEQRETLQVICNAMYETARTELHKTAATAEATTKPNAYQTQFQTDLEELRKQQQQHESKQRQQQKQSPTANKIDLLPSGSPQTATAATTTTLNPHMQRQEEHLDFMASHLDELGNIAHSLSLTVEHQTETVGHLETKTEQLSESTQMVTRRADRIIQKKSWTPVPATFSRHVTIRHVRTGLYLSVSQGNQLTLTLPQNNKLDDAVVFGVWKRQGAIFGLQNRDTRKWMGQNLLGNVTCGANQFGRREEWEAAESDDWSNTRLLVASAGWGAGGYLVVSNPKTNALGIGGSGVEERKHADRWCVQDYTVP